MPPRFIGVVHLPPLPGGPRPSPGLDAVIERAVADAETLARGGADGLVVENLGDAPFAAEQVDPYTIAAMTRAVAAVRVAVPTLELGVNVLRNDAAAALSIAAATDAAFIRINVHIGAMITDQGLIQGQAWLNGETVYRLLPEMSLYFVLRGMLGVLVVLGALMFAFNVLMTFWKGKEVAA